MVTPTDIATAPLVEWAFEFDPHGKFVIYASNENDEGILQLYQKFLDTDEPPRQLTSGEEPVKKGFLSQQGDKLAILKDEGGNELYHVFILDLLSDDLALKKVSNTPSRSYSLKWHPNGKEIARNFEAADRSGLESLNIETGGSEVLFTQTASIYSVDYSANGEWIACQCMREKSLLTDILVVNRKNPREILKYSLETLSYDGHVTFSPDNKWLAFSSSCPNGNEYIVLQEFHEDNQILLPLEEHEVGRDFQAIAWAPDSSYIVYPVEKHGRSYLRKQFISGDQKSITYPFPEGSVHNPQLSTDGTLLAFFHSSMISPGVIYSYTFKSEELKVLTPHDLSWKSSELQKPQSIFYKSFDGRTIHGWYIPPVRHDPSVTKYPGMMYIHGGPYDAIFDEFWDGSNVQMMSQMGFGVFCPNYRGSLGYGLEFRQLINGDVGGADFQDVVYGTKWFGNLPEIDESRIVILGGSYGGHTTLYGLGKEPELYRAGIALVPVVDWVAQYEMAQDQSDREFTEIELGGSLEERRDFYVERSPLTYVDQVKAPVLIIAGADDSRCPIEPIRTYVKKLRARNVPVYFDEKEEEGHMSIVENREEKKDMMTQMFEFLQKHVLN